MPQDERRKLPSAQKTLRYYPPNFYKISEAGPACGLQYTKAYVMPVYQVDLKADFAQIREAKPRQLRAKRERRAWWSSEMGESIQRGGAWSTHHFLQKKLDASYTKLKPCLARSNYLEAEQFKFQQKMVEADSGR